MEGQASQASPGLKWPRVAMGSNIHGVMLARKGTANFGISSNDLRELSCAISPHLESPGL